MIVKSVEQCLAVISTQYMSAAVLLCLWLLMWGLKKFVSSHLLSSPSWANNQINKDRFSGKCTKFIMDIHARIR